MNNVPSTGSLPTAAKSRLHQAWQRVSVKQSGFGGGRNIR
jgi:hypothetical protein